ncbi:bacterio-opsin activator domain-containing protein [Halomicrococcus sp. NG-SE-24]|uniref:helix-turn-helix domain-containing protein n=1 Tax=Halomicrococcus sp. NG-SE-24 TaxID=3436928 RepID=UPI003D97A944
MSVIADFTIPAEAFTLQRALTAAPDMTVEAERLASHSAEWALPFLWASSGDFERFHGAMQDDPTVASMAVIEEADSDVLYKIHWSDSVIELVNEMIDQEATILEAQAQAPNWWLRLRFSEEKQVSSFHDHFAERGHRFEVGKVYHPSAPRQRKYGLTTEQRDTLVAASRKGYFSVPRDLSTEELADVLGVSSNAVSQRIRRACANLVQHTLMVGTDEEE